VSPAPLAVSLGEPSGIGPEIIVKAWAALRETGPAFVVVGDAQSVAAAPGANGCPIRVVARPGEVPGLFTDALPVLDSPLVTSVIAGQPSPAAAQFVIRWIETAAGLVLSGDARALVTAPIAKGPLYAAGFAFPGHTEFLGQLTASGGRAGGGPVMMLAAGNLRASLVTIHEPIARVPTLLTVERIVAAGLITARALTADFGIDHPRLAVSALNPHAGEGGALGDEEATVIGPAVQRLADCGVDCTGPHPADTLFHEHARRRYDAVLCMYHDQALIPVKMLDFWGGVNVTLGLPIVRTSPDHGVGLDIAGRGLARPDSLIAALRLASEIAERRAAA
jgi:4-hydroxythreonine-4-phosphate dehydrogenase